MTGAGDVGSVIKCCFNGGGADFVVTQRAENSAGRWKQSGNVPEAWVGTEILFRLQVEGKQKLVLFTHPNWQNSTDFLAHCSTKWAVFLISLKDAVEESQGRPFPNGAQI